MYRSLLVLTALLPASGCQTFDPSAYNDRYKQAKEAETCFVHSLKMKKEAVPILYGFVVDSGGPSQKTRILQFPFASWEIEGGCELTLDAPSKAEVMICKECEAAKLRWIRLHEHLKWSTWQLKRYQWDPLESTCRHASLSIL